MSTTQLARLARKDIMLHDVACVQAPTTLNNHVLVADMIMSVLVRNLHLVLNIVVPTDSHDL